jgi:cytoskeletal protein CcmA (bactofilin family)
MRGKNDPAQPADKNPAPEQLVPAYVTTIGENISIDGIIHAEEDIVIEGSLKGSVIAKSCCVTIGKNGKAEGDIQAENIVIIGRMKGNLFGFNKVRINAGADFTGQIKAKSVAVEDGAFLKASIELDKEIREKAPSAAPHRIEAIMFPADAHNDTIPLRELSKPNCIN